MTMTAQQLFTYGSGGTSVDVYVQTSFDGGTTWCDAFHFPQILLASRRDVGAVTQAGLTPAAATDATLAAATANAGMFGGWWRVKYVVVGTYAGGTTLRVDAFGNVMLVPAGVNAFN
jgi:hypothetical protein